jgi:hypothetical protein
MVKIIRNLRGRRTIGVGQERKNVADPSYEQVCFNWIAGHYCSQEQRIRTAWYCISRRLLSGRSVGGLAAALVRPAEVVARGHQPAMKISTMTQRVPGDLGSGGGVSASMSFRRGPWPAGDSCTLQQCSPQ